MTKNKLKYLFTVSISFSFLLLVYIFTIMHSINDSSDKINHNYIPIISNLNKVQLTHSTAHLWFEELLSGDSSIIIEDIFADYTNITNLLLETKKLLSTTNSYILKIDAIHKDSENIHSLIEARYKNRLSGKVGDVDDEHFDIKFLSTINSLNILLDEVKSELQDTIKDLNNKKRILSFLLVLLIFLLLFSIYHYMKLQHSYHEQLNMEVQEKTKELTVAKEKAEEANEAKSNFLASMSHEIRTPMTGLLGFIERLKNKEEDPERIKQFNIVENSGRTLLAIINDILDFSKIESGKIELEHSPYSIHKLFSSSMDVFISLSSGKNISMNSMIDENLPTCLIGDEVRLKQIIFNLLSNAIKFTSNYGQITLNASYNNKNQTVNISVIDTGVGIAKANLDKIFEAFSQEDTSTTRRFGGTGLGLSISSHLVKLMNGELKVESQVGYGSKFYFEIPVKVCLEDTISDSIELDEEIDSEVDLKGHVLVVEDNKTNQVLMKIILDDLGVTYDVANDGAEGLLCFKENKYDAVLMDENMPKMNGIEATKNIREIEQSESLTPLPIIAVTANALTGDKEKFIDAGMNDYVPKPYTEEDIVKVLQRYLG